MNNKILVINGDGNRVILPRDDCEWKMIVKQGTYRGKQITAVLYPGTSTIQRFQYNDEPGIWYFPQIENGMNVEREKFEFLEEEE